MKEALKLALEALEVEKAIFYPQTGIAIRAITAIKAALAQPVKELTNIQRHEQNVQKLFGTAQPADHSEQHLDMVKAQPAQEPVAIKRMKEWIEYLKRKSDFGQHMKIPCEISAGTCWELAIELEQFINTTPPQLEERNFCSRCGKRTADLTTIHTCTPPQETTE
jgi:hypothetical protein